MPIVIDNEPDIKATEWEEIGVLCRIATGRIGDEMLTCQVIKFQLEFLRAPSIRRLQHTDVPSHSLRRVAYSDGIYAFAIENLFYAPHGDLHREYGER